MSEDHRHNLLWAGRPSRRQKPTPRSASPEALPVAKMSKMDAVGTLCEIKADYQGELDRLRERAVAEVDPIDSDMPTYRARRQEALAKIIRALEIAGASLTR